MAAEAELMASALHNLKYEGTKEQLREIDDHVGKRYEIEKRLGRGAYGIVWKARSKRSGRVVAVKKIFDAFRNKTDAQRTFREIVFLKAFRDHPNIVQLFNVHRADNNRDLYLVFEYMNTDLQRAIHRRPGILKNVHKRFIMYQLLSATRYLHAGNVIHRDQKPSNVLLDTECTVKIADFGLARSLTHLNQDVLDQEGCLTDYVATRWYRAPEILLGCKKYTTGVDLWSLGCILGEMLLERPLYPGSSTLDQIEKIFTSSVVKDVESLKKFRSTLDSSDYAASLVDKAISAYKNKDATDQFSDPFQDLVRLSKENNAREGEEEDDNDDENSVEQAIDLMKLLAQLDPHDRITADDAIKHPYVEKFFNPSLEDKVERRIVLPPLSDDIQLSVEEYRFKLYEIIQYDKRR